MGVLGAPLLRVGAMWGSYWYLHRLSVENGRLKGSQCAQYGEFPYKAAPIRFFKIVWGLRASTEDPQIQVAL